MPTQALPLISGGEDRRKELGNIFILDTAQPNEKAREACLLALQVIGIKADKLRERYHVLYLEHPSPAARKRYLDAFFAYADITPWRDEALRWMPHLAAAAVSATTRALEAAKAEDWDAAGAALDEIRTVHPRLLNVARLDEAKVQIARLKELSRLRAQQNALYAQYQAGHAEYQRLIGLHALAHAPDKQAMEERLQKMRGNLKALHPQLSTHHQAMVKRV